MKEEKTAILIKLDPEFVKKLDVMADKIGITRTQLMRNLLESAYDDAVMLDKIGLIAAFKFGMKAIKNLKKGIASGKVIFDEKGEFKIRR